MKTLRLLVLCLLLCGPARLAAQTPNALRDDLLRYVPKDFGLCVTLTDLRGHAERWEKKAWTGKLRQASFVKTILDAPEVHALERFHADLQKHVGFNWAILRDDVLGDAVVLAYHPGPDDKAESEQGLVLLHARKPAVLRDLLDRVNKIQMQQGELRTVEEKQHAGVAYMCRHTRGGSQFYLLDGPFFAFSGEEKVLQSVIDERKRDPSGTPAIAEQLRKASADKALANLWVNPRLLLAEIERKAAAQTASERVVFSVLAENWRALDGIILSVSADEKIELRLSLQAGDKKMFHESAVASDLWQRFPENAIFAVAGRLDFAAVLESVKDLVPAESRKAVTSAMRPISEMTGLDPVKRVLPNIGPDWGFCIASAENAGQFPRLLAALAVKPGSGEPPVDQTIYQGLYPLAVLGVLDHNQKNPNQPIRLRTLHQDKVELKSLVGEKLFPSGVEPAFGLKGGYLVFASSPEAIKRFAAAPVPAAKSEDALVARFSTAEFAKLVRAHRALFVGHIAARNQSSAEAAAKDLENLISALDLIDRVDLTHRSGGGQASWAFSVRLAE